jgi:hypothetical protein
MFFSGSTIFSYGYHFPIATRVDNVTFFNLYGYSNTTAKHKSLVRTAINGDNIIECACPPTISEIERGFLENVHAKNLAYWDRSIGELFKQLDNPRTRNKTARVEQISKLNADYNAYKKYFNL